MQHTFTVRFNTSVRESHTSQNKKMYTFKELDNTFGTLVQ